MLPLDYHLDYHSNQEDLRSLPEFPPELVRTQIAQICASSVFANSPRMQRFLKLAVEYTLAGRAQELKEYLIGVEAFDRPASFDPREDPIIRVEARRLRNKLKQYYEGPGRDDPFVVEFSKGTYVPYFSVRSATPRPGPELKCIAVLPFRNLGPEPDHEYFSDGLSEELIHLLTTVPGLQVVAWHSSAQLKSVEWDLNLVRRQLKVDAILCGTVRRVADHLRITAQLIATSDGRYLWSDLYERRLQDLFAIEEDIAWAIVNTLQIRSGRKPVAAGSRQKVTDVEAHNLFLLGRFHANRRTPEGLLKSLACFEKAVSINPDDARAHGGLAETYALAADYGIKQPCDYVPMAKAAARRALELDPLLAEAYTSLAFLRSNYDWEWIEAERLFRRAIEINPGYATAHHWFGLDHLANLARWEEAQHHIQIARRLDPLSAIILQSHGYLALLMRDYNEAIRSYGELFELDPLFPKTFSALGRAYMHLGRYDEAIDAFHKALALSEQSSTIHGALGQAYAMAGRTDEARQKLLGLTALAEHSHVPATCFAVIHIGLGENSVALDYLEMGAARRDLSLATLKVHPAYDPIRTEPRFEALLRRIGLDS
jgi:TolB-like protein/Flp pilus assembly protein TadD